MRSNTWQRIVASIAFVVAFAAAIVGSMPSAQAASAVARTAITGKTTGATPGMVANGNTLYVAYTGTDSAHHIYMASSTDGVNFSQVTLTDTALAGTGPALCVFAGHVYVVFQGTDSHIYVGWFEPTKTALHNHTSIPNSGYDQTSSTPGCAALGNQLYIAWRGPDNLIRLRRSSDGTTWSSDNRWVMTESASSGVGLTSYPASGGAQELDIVWAGTDTPHHLNWGNITDNFNDPCNPGDPASACNLSSKATDASNYTNNAPQIVGRGTNNPFMTWKSATTGTIYGRGISNFPPPSINGPIYTFTGSSATGISLANWNGQIYGAWGGSDSAGTLNVALFFN